MRFGRRWGGPPSRRRRQGPGLESSAACGHAPRTARYSCPFLRLANCERNDHMNRGTARLVVLPMACLGRQRTTLFSPQYVTALRRDVEGEDDTVVRPADTL